MRAYTEEFMEAALMRQNTIAHEQQERRKCNRAAKIQTLCEVLADSILPDDQEGEQGDPRDEQDDSNDLSLLNRIGIVACVEEDQNGNDQGANDCTCSGEDSGELVVCEIANEGHDFWAICIFNRADLFA